MIWDTKNQYFLWNLEQNFSPLRRESNNVIQLFTYGPTTNEELFSAFREEKGELYE